jgi:hypothetical protein
MNILWHESSGGEWVAYDETGWPLARVALGGNGYWCMWHWGIEKHLFAGMPQLKNCKTLAGIKRRAEKYIMLWAIAGRPT